MVKRFRNRRCPEDPYVSVVGKIEVLMGIIKKGPLRTFWAVGAPFLVNYAPFRLRRAKILVSRSTRGNVRNRLVGESSVSRVRGGWLCWSPLRRGCPPPMMPTIRPFLAPRARPVYVRMSHEWI